MSSSSTPSWSQDKYVPGQEEEIMTAEVQVVGAEQGESSRAAEDAYLDNALVNTFLEVMPDKSRGYASKMLQQANNNVEGALILAMEDTTADDNVGQKSSAFINENAQLKAFLEVMPDTNRDYASKLINKADGNVQQALLLAMEDASAETEREASQTPHEQHHPRSPRPMAPQHQPSLTTSDLYPSERSLLDTESFRFMAQFADEVPIFRPDDSPSPPPSSKRRSSRTTVQVPPKSSMRPSKHTPVSSSVRFSHNNEIPNGASDNSDVLKKMARVVTYSIQESSKGLDGKSELPIQRTSVHVGWNDNLYVPRDYDEEDAISTLNHRGKSMMETGHSSMPEIASTIAPPKRKNTLIVDKEKRDTRWQWAQALVGKTFAPYRAMLSEQDDLLPDDDEFEAFEASGANTDEEFESVRDAMLDDYDLTEREVAAFFEGFALFNVKLRSLQSQVESLKSVSRVATEPRSVLSMHRSLSALPPSRSTSALKTSGSRPMDTFSQSISRMATRPRDDSSDDEDDSPRMLGESLRALSIKKVQTDHTENEEIQRLLKELEEADKKQKKLEKQLKQAGVIIAEDIPYKEAKAQVERIAKRMGEIGSSEVTHPDKAEQAKLREEYFKLEQDMEKYNAALVLSDEYIEEQEELEQKWEDDNLEANLEALKKLRRHMPVNVKRMSEADLSSKPSPNGKILPMTIAKKFKRTNVLQLIRTDPEDLVKMHPAALENLRVAGLTLTERRAIYSHIKDVGPRWKAMQADKMTERKWTWFKMMKQNFKENLAIYEYHVEQYGPPGNHPYATRDNPNEGCPLIGKQCPLKADKIIDYDDDYGYTDEAEYEVSNVRKSDKEDPGAKAKREAMELARDKKANERSVGLKKHYKGKVLQVSLANGSCENMDEMLDRIEMLQTKWIEERLSLDGELRDDDKRKELAAFTEALNELKLGVLHLAERSGMQLTGKRDANADNPDKRSPIELGLCEEVYDSCVDFFSGIQERMKEIKTKDGRLNSTIEQLQELLDELHDRNVATLKELKCKRPSPSRKHKTYKDLTREAKAKSVGSTDNLAAQEDISQGAGPPAGTGDRGNLMAAIAGRGRGGRGPPGGLMDAIKAGRGGRGPGRLGPPGLMDAIKAKGGNTGRGSSGGRGGGPAGGRGDFLSQIAGRGKVE
jgi:hypothetical protein